MPATPRATTTPQGKQTPNKELIAYFSTRVGLQQRQYMSFESGFSLLCTIISARSRFLPEPRSSAKPPECDYLQRNVEELAWGLVLEPPKGHNMHLSHLKDIMDAITAAQEKFSRLKIEAPVLEEIKERVSKGDG
ncbi:MAG: hypothetical protein Q9221_006219 [Calogaya cf. arnoldii]